MCVPVCVFFIFSKASTALTSCPMNIDVSGREHNNVTLSNQDPSCAFACVCVFSSICYAYKLATEQTCG